MKERKHDIENNSTVHKMLLHIKKKQNHFNNMTA